jgi:antitoxin PrlF
MNSSISSKGQVTVPKRVRDQLGLRAGTAVEFELTDGGVILRKGHRGERPVDRVRGVLVRHRRTDDLIDDMRGSRTVTSGKRG